MRKPWGAQQPLLWRLLRDNDSIQVAVHGRFMLNNLGLMRVLAERGMGVAALATPLMRDAVVAGRLVQVLPDWFVPALSIHAVMSSRLQSASVRALLDFLAAKLVIV
jgi:DNA-binding transcriptional LysR family regulator